jgi:hypothetical protein
MADLQRVESMQYPAGHLAHLSENQQTKLNEFKQICQTGKDASHDDETMLYAQDCSSRRAVAGH